MDTAAPYPQSHPACTPHGLGLSGVHVIASLPATERRDPMQNRSTQTPWQSVEVRVPTAIAVLSEDITEQMIAAGFTDKDIFCLRLAVEEAIVNGIKHGNGADPQKKVLVRYAVSFIEAVVEIEDEGTGFNPDSIPDPLSPENIEKPSGRGIFLMRFYMTSIRYNERGNCVTLCRANSAATSKVAR